MSNGTNFNLEERTFLFAQSVRSYCKKVTHNIINIQDIKQVVRSSGSVSANYIEANESLSKADLFTE
ncbi:four helix bundle protein [Pedobacter suwonensis]|uniref:Four helix bundle protein n=1 Tax=Pedobacter suwonensis TaxID=332999 RepID=A0A1I0TJN4_9SPHI|nr:four helix bundle protein [Pedobacter suwonensis]SFA52002.1 four helix bundle protein [Pedobacter suwonensis]